jgi:beta-lactam-binding protein with PASTA domain
MAMIATLGAMPVVAAELSPGLEATPSSAPTGTSVVATASGFGECTPSGFDDVSPKTPVPPPEPGTVAFSWDGEDFAKSVVDPRAGTAAATFVVPRSAFLGTHDLGARCLENSKLTAPARFVVTPPTVVTVIVPNLIGQTRDGAVTILRKHHLLPGARTGDGDRVESQDPTAGFKVEPETVVDLDFGAAPARPVEVPPLVGRTTKAAAQVLHDAGLELGSVLGRGEVIESQRPVAGTSVPIGTAVDVTVIASPPPMVRVPDLIGGTRSQAATELSGLGLLLGPGSDGDAKIETQQPRPGALVPVGTTVTVTVDEQASWILVVAGSAALLLALLGGGLAGYRAHRKRSNERWVRAHVKVVTREGLGAPHATVQHPDDDGAPTTVIGLRSHVDTGSQVVEEMKV